MQAVVLWAAVLITSVHSLDYCATPCKVGREVITHTMCKFPADNPPGPACSDLQEDDLSSAERAVALSEHNTYRSLVARGLEKRGLPGPQPPATNMRQMQWDTELEAIARRWARQCSFQHDQCRNRLDGSYVGQNLVIGYSSPGAPSSGLASFLKLLYDEVEKMPNYIVSRFDPIDFHAIGHYTQMMWATTDRLGCSRVRYSSPPYVSVLVVCNYGVGGNVRGQEVYEVGLACTHCPGNWTCSSEYEGLCHSDGNTAMVDRGLVAWIILLVHFLIAAHSTD